MRSEVLHGKDGISERQEIPINATHYYSITRLETAGKLFAEGQEFDVKGLSWMDHEFGTAFLEPGQVGWDWFAIQLEDGRDLMLYQVRREDGSIDPHSSCPLVDSDGRATQLSHGDFTLRPIDKWRSPHSGGEYPISWAIEVPSRQLQLKVDAAF